MATFQQFAAPTFATLGQFLAYSQFFGGGFTTIGWVSLNGSGTVNTSGTAVTWVSGTTFKTEWVGSSIVINGSNFTISTVNSTTSITLTATAGTQTGVTYTAGFGILPATGTGVAYAFTNPVLPNSGTNVNQQAVWTYRGAWVSGQTYPNGSLSNNGTADLVTDNSVGGNGITYQKSTVNVATNLTVAPHSNPTDWQPYQYEIWKSNGANSSSFPIYIRLAYVSQTAVNSLKLHLSIGGGVDSNGNITAAVTLNAVTAPLTTTNIDNNQQSAVVFEMDMSGDADNVRFIMQRGNTVNQGYTNVVVVDRSKTAAGTDTNAFVYVGTILSKNASGQTCSGIMMNPAIGTTAVANSTTGGWVGAQGCGGCPTTLALNGGIPPFFIYPTVGYQAPPLLGCVGFHRQTVNDGNIVYVWNYGAMHAYLVCTFNNTGNANQTIDNSVTNGVLAAILWE